MLTRISSRTTVIYKWVFPIVFVGGMLSGAADSLFDGSLQEEPLVALLPFVIGLAAVALMSMYFRPVADRVEDGGEYLQVRRGAVEERIALADIMNVSSAATFGGLSRRLVLRLRIPGRLGSIVSFFPVWTFALNSSELGNVGESIVARSSVSRSAGGI
jgi:hypothetical protein